jgi:hypothetical protein
MRHQRRGCDNPRPPQYGGFGLIWSGLAAGSSIAEVQVAVPADLLQRAEGRMIHRTNSSGELRSPPRPFGLVHQPFLNLPLVIAGIHRHRDIGMTTHFFFPLSFCLLTVPFLFPIVFDQSPSVVMVVIKAPGSELLAGRFEDERLFGRGDLYPGHVIGLNMAERGTEAKESRKH